MTCEAHIHQGRGYKSGGCALKAVELTSGDLLLVANSRLRMSDRSNLSQQQKSAEGIVITRVVKARTVLREEGKESGK
jgi:hypothetical protein